MHALVSQALLPCGAGFIKAYLQRSDHKDQLLSLVLSLKHLVLDRLEERLRQRILRQVFQQAIGRLVDACIILLSLCPPLPCINIK